MYRKYIKRTLDMIVSSIVLIVGCPLFLIIAVLIKLIDKDDVLYKQNRTGKDGTQFIIYKFKTIKNGKITKLGRLLRSTSLDEIPQFYNVLKGDMSLVGPRPWIPEYYANFTEHQKKRTNVTPGLVGLAQVNGRINLNVFEKINYDIEYINNLCFWLDIKIIFKSIKVILVNETFDNSNEYIEKEIELLKKQKQK